MNLYLTTMKLLAAILFATVTVAMSTTPANEIISKMKIDLENLRKMFQSVLAKKCNTHNVKGSGGSGAIYTRWGHNKCPSQSELVYSGYTGGSNHVHYGAAAEYLCLPKNPTQSSDRTSYSWNALLYGTEYEFNSNKNVQPKHDHDVPCAVCQSLHRANSLMLPARDICPRGWRREYSGLLMAGHYPHRAASQYVCVDKARKVLPGGERNSNGKLMYVVRAECGSLKCPPYTNNQLITCAVCTN